jgi:hypothetical protein
VLILFAGSLVQAQDSQPQKTSQSSPSDLTQVNIEDPLNLEVTSASKKEQKLSRVAEAIFVITQVGQNLLADPHLEFVGPDQIEQSGLIERRACAKLTWQFRARSKWS